MLKPLRLIPDQTNIPFMRWHKAGFALTILLSLAAIGTLAVKELNFGVDFTGGMIVELRLPQNPDLPQLRDQFEDAGFKDLSIQEFGAPTDLLLRLPKEQSPTDPDAQNELVAKLIGVTGEGTEKRRIEFVGPQVGEELITGSAIALGIAIAGIMTYIWFRFERPYAIGCVITLLHDCLIVMGMYAITGMEFNLTSVAAVLMILGYSVNDTVVIYDYIRENRRKYKSLPWSDLIDQALNRTLSRTIMTGLTTMMALLSLGIFGGDVIRGFTVAILAGVVVGTFSSLFVSAPFLLYMKPQMNTKVKKETDGR